MTEKLLKAGEVAERFGCTDKLIYRLAGEGAITCYRIGKRGLRFSEDDVAAYLESRRREMFAQD